MINNNTKFLGVDSTKVDLTEKKDALNNAITEYYTAEEIGAFSGGGSSAKVAQVEITQAEILTGVAFTKTLVAPTSGKILIPLSLAVYRKPGGTNYSISNSIRLSTSGSAGTSTLGNSVDSAFTGSTQGAISLIYDLSFSFVNTLVPSNSLLLASSTPVTGGTGDLIAYITYVEIDTN
jgi:hypothetical protein